MNSSSPLRNTIARKPSHLGSNIQSPSAGNARRDLGEHRVERRIEGQRHRRGLSTLRCSSTLVKGRLVLVIGYLSPVAQLNSTLRSSWPIQPSALRLAPTGKGGGAFGAHQHALLRGEIVLALQRSPRRLTASAAPPDWRTARRIRKSPTATGTRIPAATVCASVHSSACSSPFSKARRSGRSPLPAPRTSWAAQSRSTPAPRAPRRPSTSRSSPVPPPVG